MIIIDIIYYWLLIIVKEQYMVTLDEIDHVNWLVKSAVLLLTERWTCKLTLTVIVR